jgi:hypothetical protein
MDSKILMIQDSILVCSPDPRIPHTALVLCCQQDEVSLHTCCRQLFALLTTATVSSLPPKLYPVDLRRTLSGWQIAKPNGIIATTPPPALATFLGYCYSLNKLEQDLLATVELLYPPQELMSLLTTMSFQACSDGSAVSQQGTFG